MEIFNGRDKFGTDTGLIRDRNGTNKGSILEILPLFTNRYHHSQMMIKKMMSENERMASLNEIISYTVPKIYTGVEWYIGFYAFDPARNKMRRKKIKLNHIEKIGERRAYARDLIKRLQEQLQKGWNPWIEQESRFAYITLSEAVNKFFSVQAKYLQDDVIREATFQEYKSKIRNLLKYNETRDNPISYIYQLDHSFLKDFLNYIYIDRGNTAQTHNNYIRVLSVFCNFLLKNGMHKTNIAETLDVIGKRRQKKNRTVIEDKDLVRLRNYLDINNQYFLLACYIEYYCLIRPKEMTMIKIRDISFENQTIFVSSEISKNRKDANVTFNEKILHLMIKLKLHSYPMDSYVFSDGFKPGEKQKSDKIFRDYWLYHVVRDLNFPTEYKFYSLKDSGITSLIKENVDSITVRDQARHSSINITDIYTPHDSMEANEKLKEFDSVF